MLILVGSSCYQRKRLTLQQKTRDSSLEISVEKSVGKEKAFGDIIRDCAGMLC